MKQQRGEALDARFERRPAIGLPEKSGIPQPRRDDALGIPRDRPLVVRFGVDDRQKCVLQSPVVAFHRKIVLVVNQRRRQHFLRELEEFERERTRDH